jgi:hypothetical protein
MKIYDAKTLIHGHRVRSELAGKVIVCCKSSKGYTHIRYKDQIMKIPSAPLTTLSFQDKYGRRDYSLDYYEWTPVSNLWELNDLQVHCSLTG